MECGKPIMEDFKHTKDTTQWIKNQDTVYTCGTMDGVTREISKMTTEMDMESYTMDYKN